MYFLASFPTWLAKDSQHLSHHSTSVILGCHLPHMRLQGSPVPGKKAWAPLGTQVTFPYVSLAKGSHVVTSNFQSMWMSVPSSCVPRGKAAGNIGEPWERPPPAPNNRLLQALLFTLIFIVAVQQLKNITQILQSDRTRFEFNCVCVCVYIHLPNIYILLSPLSMGNLSLKH